MSNPVSKITKLDATESFLQVNFEKGYKYIDKAGQLVNDFYINDKEPIFRMDLKGMVLRQEEDIFEEAKVTPKNIWIQYRSPDSLERISDHYINTFKRVSTTISAENFSRVGWRTYFVKEFNTLEDRDKALNKFTLDESLEFKTGVYEGKVGEFSLNFFVSKVFVQTDNSDRGVLIDVDLYKKFEDLKKVEDIEPIIISIREAYKSDELLALINKTLST